MRIVYMGTPDFAVAPLARLLKEGYEVCGVFTRQDKPKGRGMKLVSTPVKVFAQEHGLPVYQPAGFKNGEALETLRELNPDVIVVVAYGRILPREVLELPPYGCINVHASLLPQLRGAAPIQWSIARGLGETGVTTMHMSQGVDEGDMIYQERTAISAEDNAQSLHDRLAELGCGCLIRTLRDLEVGTAPRTPQNNAEATFAPPIAKEDTKIDWNKPAGEVLNLMRGMDPWPGAWTVLKGEKFRLFSGAEGPHAASAPGTILQADSKKGLLIACGGETSLYLEKIQAPGGKRMAAGDYLRGHQLPEGGKFGEE